MKIYTYIFIFLTLLSCSCRETKTKETVYPEWDIKEIRIYGRYQPEDPKRLENMINNFITGDGVISQSRVKNRKEFEERYPHYLDIGDEKFHEHPQFHYCYDRALDNKEFPFNKDLRVRLYNKEEKIIAEDYLRVTRFDEQNNSFSIVSYILYHKEGHFFQVVRLEGTKEVVLWKPGKRGFAIVPKAELIHLSKPLPQGFDNEFEYDKKIRCHYSTFKPK